MLNRSIIVAGTVGIILGLSWAGAQQGPAQQVVVVNGTRTAMIMLQIKPSHLPGWLPDVLGRKPLGVQKETVVWRDGSSCLFDVKAIFEDGHRVMRQRVDLCKSPRYVVGDF